MWRRSYSSTHSLISALDGGEWSASFPGRFTSRERAPGTHSTGGWVHPRAVLDAMVKRKIPSSRRESNPRTPIVQHVALSLYRLSYHGSCTRRLRVISWFLSVPSNRFSYCGSDCLFSLRNVVTIFICVLKPEQARAPCEGGGASRSCVLCIHDVLSPPPHYRWFSWNHWPSRKYYIGLRHSVNIMGTYKLYSRPLSFRQIQSHYTLSTVLSIYCFFQSK
jgi:hypothetical protein